MTIPGDELLFLPLGGSGEIGMNVNLFGCQGKWIMVDLGMTFADPSLPGVELVLPDLTFIERNRDRLLGVVLTHGHEDHLGAVPYLAGDLKVPVYATPFTAGLLREKLKSDGFDDAIKVKTVSMGATLELGPFKIRYVHLAHSIPEGNALVIETPYGRLFHTGDWKLDDEPLMGKPSTPEQLTAIGDSGVLALVGDSTNVFNREASGSEGEVRRAMLEVVKGRKGRVLVTTFASNAARVDTIGHVANETGRQLCVVGRSLDRIIRVAKASGYLKHLPPLIDPDEAMSLPPQSVLFVATGCQGEQRAALARIAAKEHNEIRLSKGDLVIFSSKQIPGNELAVGVLHNALVSQGVEVITEKGAHVHVSGHPGRPELEAMYGWIRPQIAVPVHGEMRHMTEHATLALSLGVPDAIVPTNGAVIRLAPDGPKKLREEAAGRLVLDGDVIVPADGLTMVQRRRLLFNGYLSVSLALQRGKLLGEPVFAVQGLPLEEDLDDFVAKAKREVVRIVETSNAKDVAGLSEKIRIAIRSQARDYTGKRPIAEVHIIKV